MTKTKTAETAEVKEQAPKKALTRAEKSRRQKEILRGLLLEKDYKWNELLDAATQKYAAQHLDEEYDAADLKGKLGSSFSLMEEGGEVTFDKKTNLCALVKKEEEKAPAEPKKRGRKKAEKAEEKPEGKEEKKTVKKQAKKAEKEEEKTPAEPKKRGRKKAEPVQKTEESSEPKQEEAKAEKQPKEVEKVETVEEIKEVKEGKEVKEEKAEIKPLTPVFDMTELFVKKDDAPAKTPAKTEEKAEVKAEVKAEEKPVQEKKDEKKAVLTEFAFLGNAGVKAQTEKKEKKENKENKEIGEKKPPVQAEAKPEQKTERPQKNKPEQKPEQKPKAQAQRAPRAKATVSRELSEDEKLKGEFLKKLRSLGGTYFEYYSVYLLERYSLKNGRRLEGLKISGGDTDGGIDGEIELTDKFGFREVIYIQAKNWDPSKGDKDKWVVGETLLQQFVGAVTYRQAKEGKRKCRGIFVTTSRFTEGAREILESLSADFIGYDGDDVYEAAKECSFGLYEKDGKWQLDDKLLSGEKAFFDLL